VRFDRAVAHGKAGRPPGAQNKTTREMLDFIRKTLGDPMLESARWAMHTPESLALVLGCSKAEAFDRIEKLRADLRPYFYAKQAPVDSDGKAVPGLTVSFTGMVRSIETRMAVSCRPGCARARVSKINGLSTTSPACRTVTCRTVASNPATSTAYRSEAADPKSPAGAKDRPVIAARVGSAAASRGRRLPCPRPAARFANPPPRVAPDPHPQNRARVSPAVLS
jgi:hypothetical protein